MSERWQNLKTWPELILDRMDDCGVARLTLNRPDKANALSADLVEALLAALEAAAGDGTRLLVLDGNGKHFCAGFDFGGYETQSEGDLLLRFVRIEPFVIPKRSLTGDSAERVDVDEAVWTLLARRGDWRNADRHERTERKRRDCGSYLVHAYLLCLLERILSKTIFCQGGADFLSLVKGISLQ